MTRLGRVSWPGGQRSVAGFIAVLAAVGAVSVFSPAARANSSPPLNWTLQHPAAHPPGEFGAAMAYDAATRTAVLSGGCCPALGYFRGTWTWDGTNWTKQHPAASPSARASAAMAYDAATHTVVLFGGGGNAGEKFGDTWTWDGTNWTQRHPTNSPSARAVAVMAYDAATRTVVLFGGTTSVSEGFSGAAGGIN
jgi:hypothetical protein